MEVISSIFSRMSPWDDFKKLNKERSEKINWKNIENTLYRHALQSCEHANE